MFEVHVCIVPGCSRLTVFDVSPNEEDMNVPVARLTKTRVPAGAVPEGDIPPEELMMAGAGKPAALQAAFRVLSCDRCGGSGHVGGCRACGGVSEV